MPDYSALIERIEKGSGEDSAINKELSEIHYTPRVADTDVDLPKDWGKVAGADPGYWGTNYTGSLDAALAFAEGVGGMNVMAILENAMMWPEPSGTTTSPYTPLDKLPRRVLAGTLSALAFRHSHALQAKATP